MMLHKPRWHEHPHVRTGDELNFSERAADVLKRWFGTWTILGAMAAVIVFWLLFMHDPGELMLNLGLSCLASVQGIILQIAANRGDRIQSELALSTFRNGEEILKINKAQLEILVELRKLREAAEAAADGDGQ